MRASQKVTRCGLAEMRFRVRTWCDSDTGTNVEDSVMVTPTSSKLGLAATYVILPANEGECVHTYAEGYC